MDALDRIAPRKMSKEQKQEYAIKKKEEEEKSLLGNKQIVQKTSKAFRDHVESERIRLGLSAKTPHTMFCKKCFRMKCVCDY